MNVRTRGHAGNCPAKRRKGDAVVLEKIHQSLAFRSIRIQRDIHGIVMIQSPLVMNRPLAKYRDG